MGKPDHQRRARRQGRRLEAKVVLHVENLEDRNLLSTYAPHYALAPVPPPNPAAASSTDYDPSTVLVRFRSELGTPTISAGLLPGATLDPEITLVPGLHVAHLPPGISVPDAIRAYQASGAVYYAEPNFHVYAFDTVPNDPSFGQLWGIQKIKAPAAWDYNVGDGGLVIADIDTGADLGHPDLVDNLWTNTDGSHGYNFIAHNNVPQDDNGHGTHTAGTLTAEGNNRIGVVGVNWYSQLMPLKFLNSNGSGNLADAISALNFAVTNGALVSNNSYGCSGCFSSSFVTAIQNAANYGHIFVAAAGNSGTNNDTSPAYPANYDQYSNNVLSVAATTTTDARASFSNYGANTVSLGAPGNSIYSTYWSRGSHTYATLSGTSMASPHVAGAVALLYDYYYQVYGGAYYADVINQILYNVDPVSSLASTTISGGRLNIYNAIASAAPGAAGRSRTGKVIPYHAAVHGPTVGYAAYMEVAPKPAMPAPATLVRGHAVASTTQWMIHPDEPSDSVFPAAPVDDGGEQVMPARPARTEDVLAGDLVPDLLPT